MNKTNHLTTILLFSIVPITSFAASINNGDFQTGDFTSWTQDVDGLGAPVSGLSDFTIIQLTAGNHAARIEADHWSTSGDTSSTPQDEAFFASTLFQGLNLSTAAGQNLQLSFDWTYSGEQSSFDENFIVGLNDGSGNYFDADGNQGFLLNPTDYGSGTFITTLDTAYTNSLGWSLEFQLNAGFDGFGSNITIDNVNLVASAVPVPAAFWLMGSALIGLAGYQRKNKRIHPARD